MNYKTIKTLFLSIFMGCSVWNTQAQIYVDASATNGANNGSSWSDAYTDLQPALNAANTGAEIRVASGTYRPTAAPNGSANNRNKAFHFNRNLVLKGSYNPVTNTQDFANPSILSGDFDGDDVITGSGSTLSITENSENAYHVLITEGLTSAAQIEGFLITGGFANGSGIISYSGKSFSLNLGGGMYNYDSSPNIVNAVFSGNVANLGGGIYNIYSASLSFVNTVISGNLATNRGGGIHNFYSSLSMVNTLISGNLATNSGGGMYNGVSSSQIIVNAVFSGNVANIGGGIYSLYSAPSSFVNTVFSGNLATNSGGGIYSFNSSPRFVNTVFSGNSATNNGGGMYNNSSSTPTIYNSVFYGNGVDITNTDSSTTGGNNFSENYSETGFTALDADPFLDSENPKGADGKWFTTDDGLQPSSATSPIIDAGDATKLPSDLDGDNIEAIPFDIIGRNRIAGATVDVGAYEYESTVLSVNDIDSSKLDIYSTGYKTLVIQGVLNAKTTANVYNLLGKLVVSKAFDKFSTSDILDVSTLPTGMYIVKMYNAKHQVQTKKLFIQ